MTQLPGAQTRYLDARVTTASQPELQLMLLDAAIRFSRQAQELWNDAGQKAECERLMERVLEITEELIRGVAMGATELSKRLEKEYEFAFRQLALAQLNHDDKPLQAAMKVLEFHRETWQLACEKVREDAPSAKTPMAPLDGAFAGGPSFSLQV